jgi:hypothetical protein
MLEQRKMYTEQELTEGKKKSFNKGLSVGISFGLGVACIGYSFIFFIMGGF